MGIYLGHENATNDLENKSQYTSITGSTPVHGARAYAIADSAITNSIQAQAALDDTWKAITYKEASGKDPLTGALSLVVELTRLNCRLCVSSGNVDTASIYKPALAA